MKAAYYESNGAAREVLRVGEVETPHAGAGEVRVKLATSGVNPSDVKSRAGLARKIAFPRVIPQSDGAGVIDEVGTGVPASRIGERVWIWNGQWKRPFGTAAEYITLPAAMAVPLPDSVSFAAGACLGSPAMTAFHAVMLAGLGKNSSVLVSGGGLFRRRDGGEDGRARPLGELDHVLADGAGAAGDEHVAVLAEARPHDRVDRRHGRDAEAGAFGETHAVRQ